MLIEDILKRVDEIFTWNKASVDATTEIKRDIMAKDTLDGNNDTIAGHAITKECVLVTNNTRVSVRRRAEDRRLGSFRPYNM